MHFEYSVPELDMQFQEPTGLVGVCEEQYSVYQVRVWQPIECYPSLRTKKGGQGRLG